MSKLIGIQASSASESSPVSNEYLFVMSSMNDYAYATYNGLVWNKITLPYSAGNIRATLGRIGKGLVAPWNSSTDQFWYYTEDFKNFEQRTGIPDLPWYIPYRSWNMVNDVFHDYSFIGGWSAMWSNDGKTLQYIDWYQLRSYPRIIKYLNGKYIGILVNQTVITSEDGLNFSAIPNCPAVYGYQDYADVFFINNNYVVLDFFNKKQILLSADLEYISTADMVNVPIAPAPYNNLRTYFNGGVSEINGILVASTYHNVEYSGSYSNIPGPFIYSYDMGLTWQTSSTTPLQTTGRMFKSDSTIVMISDYDLAPYVTTNGISWRKGVPLEKNPAKNIYLQIVATIVGRQEQTRPS